MHWIEIGFFFIHDAGSKQDPFSHFYYYLLCITEAYSPNTNENVFAVSALVVQGTYQKEVTNLNG